MKTVKVDAFTLPAAHQHLAELESKLLSILDDIAEDEAGEILRYNILLATHEACANIIDHAYDDSEQQIQITLTLTSDPEQMIIELGDSGRSFNIASVPNPDLGQAQEHGYGLFLMRELMDEVTYEPGSGSNRWRLVKRLPNRPCQKRRQYS